MRYEVRAVNYVVVSIDNTHVMYTKTLNNLELNETDKNNCIAVVRISYSYLHDRLLANDSIVSLGSFSCVGRTISIYLARNQNTILSSSWVSELALVSVCVSNTTDTMVPVNELEVPVQTIAANLIVCPRSMLLRVSCNL